MKSAKFFKQLLISIAGIAVLSLGLSKLTNADVSAAIIRGQIKFNTLENNGSAQIIATNLDRGFTTRTFSRDDGSFTLMALRPGNYLLKVLTTDGRQIQQNVIMQVGQVLTLNLSLEDQNQTDQPSETTKNHIEVKTSEIATYLTPEQMQRLPQINRNFLNYADLAPGVNVATNQQTGSTQVQSGGQRPDSVNLFIDGVGQKNYVLRGGVSGQDSSPGNVFPESAVAEYKVITQNYKAEFDQLSGAAISVQTKSGMNKFQGQAFYDNTNQDLHNASPSEISSGLKRETLQDQYGVTLSGPIAKDIAHFFMAYEHKHNDDFATIKSGDGSNLAGNYQSLLGKANQPFDEDLFFGKLDWALNNKNLIQITFKLRDESQLLNIGNQNTKSYGLQKGNNENRLDLKYQFTADHWVNEARFTYEDVNWQQMPATNAAGIILQRLSGNYQDHDLNSNNILNVGGATNFQNKAQNGPGLQDDLTFSNIDWQGSHILKLGIKFKQIQMKAIERNFSNPQFSFNLNNPSGAAYQALWANPLQGVGDGSTATDISQFGTYIQDDWDLNKKLSLSLGLRWDFEYNPSYLNYVTPVNVTSALRNWSNLQNSKTDYNIEDYISNGSNRKPADNNFAPRLGLAYDLLEDQQHVIFGGYARAYDRNIYDVLQLERTKNTYPNYTINFQGDPNFDCPPGPNCIAWNPNYLNYSSTQLAALTGNLASNNPEIDLLHNNLKTPFSDQFNLGMRNKLGEWNTEFTYSFVHSYNGLVGLQGGRNPDGSFGNQALPGFGSLILWENAVQTKTNSFFVKLEKPYSKDSSWGLTLAYTFSDSVENKPQSFVDSSSYLLDLPNPQAFGWQPTAGVRKHKLVATHSIDLPWDIIFSTKLTLASPQIQSGMDCSASPCHFATYIPQGSDFIFPGNWWGYRQLDLALIKSFNTPANTQMKLRLDVLNILDFRNFSEFNGFSSANLGSPLTNLAGPPLTIKLTARLEF